MSTSLSYYNVNTKKKASNSKRKTKTKLKNKQSKTKKNMKGSGPTFSMLTEDSLNEKNNNKNESFLNSIMSLHPGVSKMYEKTKIPKNKKSLKKQISVSAPKPKAPTSVSASKSTLYNVMTYNIYEYFAIHPDNPKMGDKILDLEPLPDIIFTQEDTNGKILSETNSKFNEMYSFYNESCGGTTPETVGAYYLKTYNNEINFECIFNDNKFVANKCLTSRRNCLIATMPNGIRIAGLHLEGGRFSDSCIKTGNMDKVIEHKKKLISDVISKDVDVICGDFNSVYSSDPQTKNDFIKRQKIYFQKNILNQTKQLSSEQIKIIEDLNNSPYNTLVDAGYYHCSPSNEEVLTNGRGESIVDTVWNKDTVKVSNTKILDYGGGIGYNKIGKTEIEKDKILSDHNPIIFTVQFNIKKKNSLKNPSSKKTKKKK